MFIFKNLTSLLIKIKVVQKTYFAFLRRLFILMKYHLRLKNAPHYQDITRDWLKKSIVVHCSLFRDQNKKNLNFAEVLSFVSNPFNQTVTHSSSLLYIRNEQRIVYHIPNSHLSLSLEPSNKKGVAMVSYNGFILDIGQYCGQYLYNINKLN